MLQQQVRIINSFLMIFDAVGIIAAGYGAYFLKIYMSQGHWEIPSETFIFSILFVMFMNNYMMGRFGLYDDKRATSIFQLTVGIFKSVFLDFAFLATGIFLTHQEYYSRVFLLLFAVLSFFSIFFLRIFFRIFVSKSTPDKENQRKMAIIGSKSRAEIVAEVLQKQLSFGMGIMGRISADKDDNADVIGNIENLAAILKENPIDEVVFAIDSGNNINIAPYLEICKKAGVSFRILPALWKTGEYEISVEKCQNVPFLTFQVDNFNATGLLYKRVLDLAGGLVGTLIFLIMYPFVAVAIKLDSKGPVLFKQERKGMHGRVFELYKFRSMYADAEDQKKELMAKNVMNGAMFKMADDPRITRVGKFIRKTSIDEFPQFLNVLKGDMSLVGTRPPTLDEVETYELEHLKRISAKPGITGLWQISGRNKITDFEEVVALDSTYLNNWRFTDDLKIIFKTIWVVLQRKGAV